MANGLWDPVLSLSAVAAHVTSTTFFCFHQFQQLSSALPTKKFRMDGREGLDDAEKGGGVVRSGFWRRWGREGSATVTQFMPGKQRHTLSRGLHKLGF